MSSTKADYACSKNVAQALDRVIVAVAISSTAHSKYAMGNNYEYDTAYKAIYEHLEANGLTTHEKRRSDYVSLLGTGALDGNQVHRNNWGIPVDTSGILFN